MSKRSITPADLARLKRQREEADRRYNDALTELDAAIQRVPEMPHPPPAPDEHQITPLNRLWNIVPDDPTVLSRGWTSRLKQLIWRTVGGMLQQQQEFNSALVDHINRNVAMQRETRRAIETIIAMFGGQLAALVAFESRLIVYLQQVTPYVDTKDREVAGLLRRTAEDNRELIDGLAGGLNGIGEDMQRRWESIVARERRYDARFAAFGTSAAEMSTAITALQQIIERDRDLIEGFAGGLSGIGDELQKRWASMLARERRYDARVTALTADADELRTTIGMLQRSSAALRQEFERVQTSLLVDDGAEEHPTRSKQRVGRTRSSESAAIARAPAVTPSGSLLSPSDSYKYVGFEEKFRGTSDDIRLRVAEYLPFFEGASDVLDVGCGRGEFLDLLRESGVSALGVDINHEMVEVCRSRGLAVTEADALSYLSDLADESLGGLIAAQVVEHLRPEYLLRLLDVAYQKLRPGSTIILETINPACWAAYFDSYIRDLTHERAIHPETLQYLLVASGFQHVEIRYRAPFPELDKLQPLALPRKGTAEAGGVDVLETLAVTFNENVAKINALLFTYLDYATIGRKL